MTLLPCQYERPLIGLFNYVVRILRFVRGWLKQHAALLVQPFGFRLLSKAQTAALLRGTALVHAPGEALTLPEVVGVVSPHKRLFAQQAITTASARVWRYENVDGQAVQLRNGSLMIQKQVLDTDFGNSAAMRELFTPTTRPVRAAKLLIAPWSHYWTGYFDYVFFVALKLCRIKNTLSAEAFAHAVVCYPLVHSPYERDLLAVLGVKPENLLDSRRVRVRFDTCLLGSNDSWFYPNRQDVLAFRQLLVAHLPEEARLDQRLYIRRAGRRRVVNEHAVLALVQRHGFRIVEDEPRTLAEQGALYAHAAVVLGPHGASFANILWCQPGTHLFELFPDAYMPGYFRYLAQALDLRYSAYCHGAPAGSDHGHVADDVAVDVDELDRCLTIALARP